MKKKRKMSVGKVIFGVATVLVLLIAASLMIGSVSQIRDSVDPQRYLPREESIRYSIARGEYYTALGNIRELVACGVQLNGATEEAAAVAYYYDAAVLCKAYEKTGNAEQAELQRQRMQSFASATGTFQEHLTKIDALLENY